jgi:dCTP deaminase
MYLSDGTIIKLCNEIDLITPFNEEQVQPCSYDMLLEEVECSLQCGEPVVFKLAPSQHCLAVTVEHVNLPDWIGARVEGKSSLGRMGLFIHITAGWIDPGFRGQITLELYNASDKAIYLPQGRKICQLALFRLDKPSIRPYNGRYQDSKGIVESRDDHIGIQPTGIG